MSQIPVPVVTIGLLLASNIFMTFAWYGHLKYKSASLILVILASWLIALPEYALQVPANRLGHGHFSAAELKTIQEIITLTVFAVFSVLYLKEPLGWNHAIGFAFIAAGAFFIFHRWS
ncbi:MAG: membrane protein [Rhodobacter sp. CACIA14H1]|nr:MAG: membrane protein [Rhodobacter sp. CACIA14H1]